LHYDERRACIRTAIADFGLSNPVTNASLLVSAYQPVEMRGKSLSYASPETFKRLGKDKKARLADPTKGKPHLLLHSDTYAFAIILYELLTRKKPYTHNIKR
jgi:serine/threonine protein kinase